MPYYFRYYSAGIIIGVMLFVTNLLPAQNQVTQRDITEPTTSVTEAICGPLQIITLCTHQPDSLERFLTQGMGLRKRGPISYSSKEIQQLSRFWHIPDNMAFQIFYYDRPAALGTILLRVLSFERPIPETRSSYGPKESGPFTIGFPNNQQEKLHEHLLKMGYTTLAPLQASWLSKPDGSQYKYLETIYKGPEWLHAVGIERGNGMPPLSNIDTATQMGGPGYSAMNVTGTSDTMLAFFTQVLGYELRRDQVWKTGNGSALGLPAGLPFRFSIAYAKGSTSGHLLFLDFLQTNPAAGPNPPHLPNKGIGMYSFYTNKLEDVLHRAKYFGATLLTDSVTLTEPLLGKSNRILLLAPNQVYIEIIANKL
ncbi:MAG: hypothetical protein EBX50_02530 [Chitinophagia bacterium]|nr:hypothetical protein [Chitinophagia bacterium]